MNFIQGLASDFRRSTDELRFVPRDLLRILRINWVSLLCTLIIALALNRIFVWLSVALSFVHPIFSALIFPFAALSIMAGVIAAIWIIEKDLVYLNFEEPYKNRFNHLLHSSGALILPFVGIYTTTGWFADDYLDRRIPLLELQTDNYLRSAPLQLEPTPNEGWTIFVFCAAIFFRFVLKWSGASRKHALYAWVLAYCEALWMFSVAQWFTNVVSAGTKWSQRFRFWDWWESSKELLSVIEPIKAGIAFIFSTVLLLPVAWIMFVQLVLQKVINLEENSPLPRTMHEWSSPQSIRLRAISFTQLFNETVLLLMALGPVATTLVCFYFNLFWVPENVWRWLLDVAFGPITEPGAEFYLKSSLLPFGKVAALLIVTTLSCVIADRSQGNMLNRLRGRQSP